MLIFFLNKLILFYHFIINLEAYQSENYWTENFYTLWNLKNFAPQL